MKRVVIIALTVLMSMNLWAVDRKEREKTPPRYELRLGYGGLPMHDEYYGGNFINYHGRRELYGPYYGPVMASGNFVAEFDVVFKKWLALSAGIYTDFVWRKKYDGFSGNLVRTEVGATITALPQVRFTYLNREYVSIYSSIGVGIGLSAAEFVEPILAFQTVPVGLTFGKKVFGFAEICIGTVNMGVNVGVGYRF